jgi:hypothetical protein
MVAGSVHPPVFDYEYVTGWWTATVSMPWCLIMRDRPVVLLRLLPWLMHLRSRHGDPYPNSQAEVALPASKGC